MPLKCNFLPIRELPHSFASGSLTVAAIKWKQKAIGNLKRTILKTEKFILTANGFLKSSEVRPRRRWRGLFGCVNSRVLAWCFGTLCHGQMYQGILPPCYSRCTVSTPGWGKLSLWCKLWATIDYITSSSPVIRIGRKKTLVEKFKNQSTLQAVLVKSETPQAYKGKTDYQQSFDGNFGEFGPFLRDLWSFELEQSASHSTAFFPYFFSLIQLKILNINKMASKWLY